MTQTPCKICGHPATLFGEVDFSKNCEERRGLRLAETGIPVRYWRCATCGFIFTSEFDSWTSEQFRREIYNDAYSMVDPDYGEARPVSMATMIARTFSSLPALSVLDYGSGNGRFAELLSAHAKDVRSYDPFTSADPEVVNRQYDIVTCFEVLEHDPRPLNIVAVLARAASERGIVVFSTLVLNREFENEGINWWYIAPRNGHVSIFSRAALATAWASVGFSVASMNDNIHVAFREIPDFARPLFGSR